MANKWQITLDVNLIEKETLVRLLKAEVCRLQDVLELTADAVECEDILEQIHSLDQLQAQIELAWIERDIELIPPPSKWSGHSSVYVDSEVLR